MTSKAVEGDVIRAEWDGVMEGREKGDVREWGKKDGKGSPRLPDGPTDVLFTPASKQRVSSSERKKKLRRNPFVSESRKLTVTRVSRHTTMDSLYIGQHNYPVLKSVRFSRPSAARLSVWDFHPFNSRWYIRRSETLKCVPRQDEMLIAFHIWIVEKIRCQYTDERAPTFLNTHRDRFKLWVFLWSYILHDSSLFMIYNQSPPPLHRLK